MLEELKELFFESCQKKQNLSEEKVLELKQAFESEMRTIEEVVSLATRNDFVPVLEYFAKNGGNLNFIINDGSRKVNLLNIASEEGALNVINYLLDNNIFSVDESVDANSKTPFHSAVEGNKITAAKLLLERNANINAKYLGHNCNVFSTTIGKVFGIYEDENGIEFDYLEPVT
ncbi:MAG: ankyrin repeat domain-containing protein [Rickettsia endosymbiont of Pentastiridius leporinus]